MAPALPRAARAASRALPAAGWGERHGAGGNAEVIARLLAVFAMIAIASGCGPAAGPGAIASTAEAASRSATTTPPTLDALDDAAVLHLLDRLTYGPRPGDLS